MELAITDLQILIFSTISLMVTAPIYISYRIRVQHEVVENDKELSYYTLSRSLRLVLINVLMISTVFFVQLTLFLAVKGFDRLELWTGQQLLALLAFFTTLAVAAYGSGMYITSIIAEEYTLQGIKNNKVYKILDLVTEMFHGPLSHMLICVSFYVTFLIIACLEITTFPMEAKENWGAYLLVGIVFGAAFGASHIANNTWEHQLPWMLSIFVIHFLIVATMRLDLQVHTFNMFLLLFGLFTNLVIVGKYVAHKFMKDDYRYQQYI